MHGITANFLLTKLNTGKKFFTRSELKDCGDDQGFNAGREIKSLLKEGLVSEAGDDRYKIVVDIYALRKKVLEGEAEKAEGHMPSASEGCRFSCLDIIRSVWRVKGDIAQADRACKEQAEGEEEEEKNRRRREYLEKRRLELIARSHNEADEDEDDDEYVVDDDEDDEYVIDEDGEYVVDEDDEDDEFVVDEDGDTDDGSEKAEPSFFEADEEQNLHKKLVDLILDGSRNSQLAVSALKLCAGEGYVSPWLLCQNAEADKDQAEFICFWLHRHGLIERDGKDENKYLLAVPESLLFTCFREAGECKDPSGAESTGGQKQPIRQSGRTADQKYVNGLRIKKDVRAKLTALMRTDLKMTRAKAITKAEGCLYAARDMGNKKAAAVYEKVIFELNNMSDYMFNCLKSRPDD